MADRHGREMVALLNRDGQDYEEQFRSVKIRIPAGKAVKMSRRDAVQFKGTYSGTVDGDPSRIRVKNLVMLPIDEINKDLVIGDVSDVTSSPPPGGVYICNYDGKEFTSQEALDKHLETLKNKTVGKDEAGNIVRMEPPELKDKDDMVSCPFCGKMGLKGAKGLQAHMKVCPKVAKPSPETEALKHEEVVG